MTQTRYIYKPIEFKSDQEVKWCPGCGNYAILNSMTRILPEIAEAQKKDHEQFALISGIGCSSRFPYYVNIYGLHSIHGRALPIATGAKVANPELSMWVTTGDGDATAIGGNHFIHAVRRNINLNVILFNNEIYGLTKGQYSPTTEFGKVTPTSPYGTVERPFNPGELILGAGGTFFARSVDMEAALTQECGVAAAKHDGMAIIEVLQNCVIFNNMGYGPYAGNREARQENTIVLKHGEPMIYGKERDKGLVLDGMSLKVVKIGENGVTEKDILVHDAHQPKTFVHNMLISMKYPEHPVALGVIRSVSCTTYDDNVMKQIEGEKSRSGAIKSVDELLNSGTTWKV